MSTRSDIVGGALSLALGLLLLVWLIPDWIEADPDLRLPVDFVPRIIAVGFILCGAALLVNALRSRAPVHESTSNQFSASELQRLAFMSLMLLIATVGFQFLPFLMVAPVVVFLAMWMFGPISLVSSLLTSTIGPLLIWVVATQLLGRVLP